MLCSGALSTVPEPSLDSTTGPWAPGGYRTCVSYSSLCVQRLAGLLEHGAEQRTHCPHLEQGAESGRASCWKEAAGSTPRMLLRMKPQARTADVSRDYCRYTGICGHPDLRAWPDRGNKGHKWIDLGQGGNFQQVKVSGRVEINLSKVLWLKAPEPTSGSFEQKAVSWEDICRRIHRDSRHCLLHFTVREWRFLLIKVNTSGLWPWPIGFSSGHFASLSVSVSLSLILLCLWLLFLHLQTCFALIAI